MNIYLAGATGVIGRCLVPRLLAAGHRVIGTTRAAGKAEALRAQGVTPVVVDMLDAEAVVRSVVAARPEVLIHQLTDLPAVNTPEAMAAARVRNARLREETAPTLVRAAKAAGVARAIVQSIAFAYAPGTTPHAETDPITVPSVQAMEQAFLSATGIEAVILRYGRLWGPGTWSPDRPAEAPTVHVEAAARAAWLAVTHGAPGIYNVAEENAVVRTERAKHELGVAGKPGGASNIQL